MSRTNVSSTAPRTARPLPLSTLGILALLSSVAPLSIDVYLPAFPMMAQDLDTTASSIQLTLTTFLIGLASGQLVIGPLSDKWGRRRPLLMGTGLGLLAAVAAALAPTAGILIAARFLQGFGCAAGVVLARAVIADRTRGSGGSGTARLMSLMMVIGGVAPVLAPLIGGVFVGLIGWRGVFWIVVGLIAVMLAGSALLVKESLPPRDRHAGGMGALVRNTGKLLGNRRYVGYTFAFVFSFGSFFAYIAASPFVLQNILGLSAALYSVAFTVNAAGLVLAGMVSARLAKKIRPRRMLTVAVPVIVLSNAGLLAVVLIGVSLWPALVLLFVSVASMGFVIGNATALATTEAAHYAGAGSALLGTSQFLAGAAASPLVGMAGDRNALPMAVVMVTSSFLAAVFLFLVAGPAGRAGRYAVPTAS